MLSTDLPIGYSREPSRQKSPLTALEWRNQQGAVHKAQARSDGDKHAGKGRGRASEAGVGCGFQLGDLESPTEKRPEGEVSLPHTRITLTVCQALC